MVLSCEFCEIFKNTFFYRTAPENESAVKEVQILVQKMNLWCQRSVQIFVFSGRATIMGIILWDFLMLYQIFLSPQVKRSAIISNKQGEYELPHELQNVLRSSKNRENFKTCQNYNLVPSLPAKMKIFSVLAKNF